MVRFQGSLRRFKLSKTLIYLLTLRTLAISKGDKLVKLRRLAFVSNIFPRVSEANDIDFTNPETLGNFQR